MDVKRVTLAIVQVVFLIVFVAICISNVMLRRELRASQRRGPAGGHAFHAGDSLPMGFPVRDRNNQIVRLVSPNRPWILIVFAPECGACEDVLKTVAAKPDPSVTLLSLSPRNSAYPVMTRIPAQVPILFVDRLDPRPLGDRGRSVPQILRIAADARIEETCPSYEACVARLPQARL